MDVLLNFKFSKPILSQSELVSMFGSMSESALKRFMKDWLDAGKDIREMGMFVLMELEKINGSPLHLLNGCTKIKLIKSTNMTMRLRNKMTSQLI